MGTALGNATYTVDAQIINTTGDSSMWNPLCPGEVVWVDDLTYQPPKQLQSSPMCASYAVSGIAYPFVGGYGVGVNVEPEKKKCNFCGTETADFRELRIGRMTNVVVCDMCMLKALSKTLTEVDKDDRDEGCSGDCECGAGEKDCGHGCKEGKEEGEKECSP
jgi:hypothetical protein